MKKIVAAATLVGLFSTGGFARTPASCPVQGGQPVAESAKAGHAVRRHHKRHLKHRNHHELEPRIVTYTPNAT